MVHDLKPSCGPYASFHIWHSCLFKALDSEPPVTQQQTQDRLRTLLPDEPAEEDKEAMDGNTDTKPNESLSKQG